MRKMVQEMSSSAVQSGNLTLLDAIKVLKSESLSEAEAVLERGLESMKDMQKQMQEQQAQQQEMMQQQQMQIKQEEMKEKQSELDNRIKIAQIAADSRIEVAEIQSEQKVNSDTMKEKNKLIVETSKADLQDQLNENQARRVSQSNLNK